MCRQHSTQKPQVLWMLHRLPHTGSPDSPCFIGNYLGLSSDLEVKKILECRKIAEQESRLFPYKACLQEVHLCFEHIFIHSFIQQFSSK